MKNVHDLLAKLAWDFSPEQLDHLFDCFKVSLQGQAQSGLKESSRVYHLVALLSGGLLKAVAWYENERIWYNVD